MLVPWVTSIDGTLRFPLFEIGPTGSWGDLSYRFRWGEGACGMYEASWTMPLSPGFEHPLLRRGTIVELMDGPYRVGSPLVMSEPGRGTGFDDPWQVTCTGIGREVEGDNSFYALDGSGDTTTIPTTAVDAAIARGWQIAGRDTSIPGSGPSSSATSDDLQTVGALLTSIGQLVNGSRWGVGQDNLVRLMTDPTTPTYHVVPGAAALGTADDDYATVVLFRYLDDVTHTYATAVSPTSPSNVETRYGRREYPVDGTALGEIPAANAQGFADGILAKSKGRLAWVGGLTLTSNEILTSGGVPASLSKVAEDVGSGCMVRLHGIFDDLLEFTGNTWLDIIVGEAKLTDGAQTIDLTPLGPAPRDLAAVVESITKLAA